MVKTRPVIQVATTDSNPPEYGNDGDGYPIIDLPVKIYLQRQEGFWYGGHEFRKAGYPTITISKKGEITITDADNKILAKCTV